MIGQKVEVSLLHWITTLIRL